MHSADEEAISVKVDGFLNGFVVDAVMFTKIGDGWSLFDLLVRCGFHRFFIFLEGCFPRVLRTLLAVCTLLDARRVSCLCCHMQHVSVLLDATRAS